MKIVIGFDRRRRLLPSGVATITAPDTAIGAGGADTRGAHGNNNDLTLRSAPQERVSKGGHAHHVLLPFLRDAALRAAPQDEV